jgi:uncharacterized protein YlxW (UPF0749 family)
MMEGGQLMVVMIVAIVMVASIIKARYGYSRHGRNRPHDNALGMSAEEHAENLRLRDEVKELKERMKVLERIAVDKENSLSRQIEELRDR